MPGVCARPACAASARYRIPRCGRLRAVCPLAVVSEGPAGPRRAARPAPPEPRSDARAHGDEVFLLEASPVGRAAVPLLGEPVERLLELRLATVLAGVRLHGDRRPV